MHSVGWRMKQPRKRRGVGQASASSRQGAVTPFAGLRPLQRQLQENRRLALMERARQRAEPVPDKSAHHDAELFRRMVGKVVPLKGNGRIPPVPSRPQALPLQRWADEDAVLRESVSDDYGAEWLLEADDTLSYRRAGLGPDVVRKLRRGQWSVSAQLDLHGLRVDEARSAVAGFLRECVKQQRRCVRIIHGKGLGSANRIPVLKEKVRRWLTQKEEVLAFVEARPDDGGSGVVLALLKA